jgi:hypothetical protein
VGPDGHVLGLDRSPEALAQARRRAGQRIRASAKAPVSISHTGAIVLAGTQVDMRSESPTTIGCCSAKPTARRVITARSTVPIRRPLVRNILMDTGSGH